MPLQPMPLGTRRLAFDDRNFIFELKYDGFRALAVIDRRPELVSRNGHPFASYAELAKQIAAHLPVNTVLDGEIVAVDRKGKPRFNDPLWPGILSVIAWLHQSSNPNDLALLLGTGYSL